MFPPCKLVISHFMNLFKIETKLSPCQSGLLSIRWRRKLVLTPSPFLQVLYNIVKHHYPPLHVCWSWCAAGAGVAVVQYWSVVTIIAQVSAAAARTTPRWTPRISYSLTQLQNGNLDRCFYLTFIQNRSTQLSLSSADMYIIHFGLPVTMHDFNASGGPSTGSPINNFQRIIISII